MRLHRLSITAFGPFAGTETVDFDALADGGLFLLCGPTGAGKTTVLDALCFALYGTVPGARQQAARLRSDHAAADRPTSVTLEVTLRGRRLKITRSPAWERPKRRGTGTTREQPRVIVSEHHAGESLVLSTRLDEAGQLIRHCWG
jgi:exonuclease SbcC